MESLDKLPTDANLDEVAQNDVLDRNKFIVNFIRLLKSVEGHYSIALDGRWGSGKTFFVKQTERVIKEFYSVKTATKEDLHISFTERMKNIIIDFFDLRTTSKKDLEINSKEGTINKIRKWLNMEPRQEKEKNSKLHDTFNDLLELNPKESISNHMTALYYDAWKNDNRQDALLSLIYEIAKNAPSINPECRNTKTTKVRIYDGIMTAAKGIVNHISGVDIEKVMNNTKEFLQEIQKQDELESLVNDFFTNLLPDDKTRLVIFIDELDRCRPDYAVQLLERIKHYMTFDRTTFVFAVNIEQLQHTIKRYYGDDFDASSYLDRFFDHHVTLPDPSSEQKIEISNEWKNESFFAKWCHHLADEFKFTLRERNHFYELVYRTLGVHNDDIFNIKIPKIVNDYYNQIDVRVYKDYWIEDKLIFTFSFLKSLIIPLGLALRIKSITDYYSFIDGNDPFIDDKNPNKRSVLYSFLENKDIMGNDQWAIFWEKLITSKDFQKTFETRAKKQIIKYSYNFLSKTMVDVAYDKISSDPKILGNGLFLESSCIQKEFIALLCSIHK